MPDEQSLGSWPATNRMEYPAPRRILLEGHPHLRVIVIAAGAEQRLYQKSG